MAAAVALVALTLPGCAVHGLSFRTDERVDIREPKDRSEVTLPFTVDWTARDVSIGPGVGQYGVFVDQAPPPPGKTAAWLFRGDSVCKGRGEERCSTPEFLADKQVFQTTDTEVSISSVRKLAGSDKRREFHEVTVVLLDATGRRVQEAAWSVQVDVVEDRP